MPQNSPGLWLLQCPWEQCDIQRFLGRTSTPCRPYFKDRVHRRHMHMNSPPHLRIRDQPWDSSHPAGGLELSVLLLVPPAILEHPPHGDPGRAQPSELVFQLSIWRAPLQSKMGLITDSHSLIEKGAALKIKETKSHHWYFTSSLGLPPPPAKQIPRDSSCPLFTYKLTPKHILELVNQKDASEEN